MSESQDERRKRLEDQYRATIVRKLRAEADRIEAGGSPSCYGVRVEEGAEVELSITHAVDMPDVDTPSGYDCWHEDVASQSWGVCVEVERVMLVEHHADLSGNYDAIENYALVDPDTYDGPTVGVASCGECGWEGALAPGERCPECATHEPRFLAKDGG